jgi:flagellar motor protein MotB
MARFPLLFTFILLGASGCRQPWGNQGAQVYPGGGAANWQASSGAYPGASPWQQAPYSAAGGPATPPWSSEAAAMNAQLNQFNTDNDNLHTQVAALQQRLQNANNYNDSLRQQLADTMNQLQQSQLQMQQMASSGQLPTAGSGQQSQTTGPWSNASATTGATIRANNGLMQRLQTVQLPGFRSWMDGDVIRIEGPTDRLFVSGTYQINANDAMTIANLANAIRQNFPQQLIGVEAHWDGTPIQPATTSHHQLTAIQSLAVFDLLVKSGLPNGQVFTMAMGSNRPRYPNATVQNGISPNRRIEIVIYPETWR